MYKFETHLHTSACSACGMSSAVEMIDAAKEKDYSGIIITNHFYHGNTCIDRTLPWKDFVNAYADEYYSAKEYGEINGITVFFGVEEAFDFGKEMLIYGLTPETIARCPEFVNMSVKEISDFTHENNGLLVCAHPYRDRAYILNPNADPDPTLFDAIECYNHANHPQENEKAFIFAKNNNLVMSAGSDVHRAEDFGASGIAFEEKVTEYEHFLELFQKSKFKILSP